MILLQTSLKNHISAGFAHGTALITCLDGLQASSSGPRAFIFVLPRELPVVLSEFWVDLYQTCPLRAFSLAFQLRKETTRPRLETFPEGKNSDLVKDIV